MSQTNDVYDNFINEIGNSIEICVNHVAQNPGKNYLTNKTIDVGGVDIIMIGPTSMTQNTVTPMEAQRLYFCLKHFLEPEL